VSGKRSKADEDAEGSTGERVLEILRTAPGPVSGPELAERLNVSRAAVWKHVRRLVAEGYRISSDKIAGYRFEDRSRRLLPAEITRQLTSKRIGRVIHHFDSIDSTNRQAMELARSGAAEGAVVIAESQTAGRGRLGRSFFSPAGVSYYGSIILRPGIPPARAPQITLLAGLAVAETIERHAGMRPGLKWPNDVHLGSLKVSGTLTEMESEADRVLHVVCGTGVNLNVPAAEFPSELRGIATSVLAASGREVDRVAFTADLWASFERLYDEFLRSGLAPLRERLDSYSILTGRQVRVESSGEVLAGRVLGIDGEGALRLEAEGGEVLHAIAGDVTLKKQ
jgi:BirA family transcriptional regulator, biotin operon repressor / biotin---[acetyl-CoA-carboxylase] ligase